MRGLKQNGVGQVAATMGPEGVMILDGDRVWHASALQIQPACTTGAGDTALAAMIWSWHNVLSPERTAAYMSAAGGMTAAKPGIAFCTLEEMLEAATQIDVRQVRVPQEG